MKFVIVLCCVVAAAFAEEKYTSKFDNVNVQEILENQRLLKSYVDCIMERGKCTSEGTELKAHLQEALETGCAKCTEKQKAESRKIIKHLTDKEPAIWEEVAGKFDPNGKFRKQYDIA